jgi:2-polyprenyl-3-methyl-5-hydroxy-6-metoxy-1,4-benzoquinol methylase
MIERLREQFKIDTSIVSSLPEPQNATPQERYRNWRRKLPARQRTPEYLLPRVVREDIGQEAPAWEVQRGHMELSKRELKERVEELGPWYVQFRLGHGLSTMDDPVLGLRGRILFRRELITGTVAAILGESLAQTTVLDIGCNCGMFSLDIAARGAKRVDGVDLRDENIAQARFLAEHYGINNATFEVSDARHARPDTTWDVVLNLGVLYHVTQPLEFIRETYRVCRQFAVIDTVVHLEPVSGYFLFSGKNVENPAEGAEEFEFHPTYRGAIDTIRWAGFSEVFEIVGTARPPHGLYANGTRRCFLAVK